MEFVGFTISPSNNFAARTARFISEFYDIEFCDGIETRTSTAVAAIFRVCFVAACSETHVNQKKNTISLVAVLPFSPFSLFFCGTKSARKFKRAAIPTLSVWIIVNYFHCPVSRLANKLLCGLGKTKLLPWNSHEKKFNSLIIPFINHGIFAQ